MRLSSRIMIVDVSGFGGIAHYTYALVKALSELSHNIQFITIREPELPVNDLPCHVERIFPGHVRHTSKIGKGLWYIVTLWIILRKVIQYRPQILHLQESKLPALEWILIRLCKSWGIKVILTIHDIHTKEDSDINFLRRLFVSTDGIILHSEVNRKLLNEIYSLNGKPPLRIIPHGNYNFLANPMAMEGARQCLSIPTDKKVLLFFGYIRPYKGVDVLVDAIGEVIRRTPDLNVIIAGKPVGPINYLTNKIHKLGLEQIIFLCTRYISLDEVRYYFSAADVVVLPYRSITQSGMVFLAYAYGKPVIASAVGGLPEMVKPGETGLLVPPDDPASLAEGICSLLHNIPEAWAMGEAGRKWVEKEFSWDSIAQKTQAVYNEVLSPM